jgi:hypothetical protein
LFNFLASRLQTISSLIVTVSIWFHLQARRLDALVSYSTALEKGGSVAPSCHSTEADLQQFAFRSYTE